MPTQAYFETEIEPLLDDPLIEFIGEIGDADKPAFLGGARALLFPIDWPEPFGLVMIEAMAAGTPVIAWRCGSTAGGDRAWPQRLPRRQRRGGGGRGRRRSTACRAPASAPRSRSASPPSGWRATMSRCTSG